MAMIDDQIIRSKKFNLDELREWYKLAKDDGFVDIELFDPENMEPRLHLSTKGTVDAEPLFENTEQAGIFVDPFGKAQYYDHASDLNHIIDSKGFHVFDSYEDQQMWELHSRGIPSSEIGRILKRGKSTIIYRIAKYRKLITNKLNLPSVKEVNTSGHTSYSEEDEYEVVDYCKDALKTTEDVMVSKIDRDREGIRTREVGYFDNLEENLRNKFTGIILIEKLELLNDVKRNSNRQGVGTVV